jgi:hypothetical protein
MMQRTIRLRRSLLALMAALMGLGALTTLSVTVAHAATSYKVFTGYANFRTEPQFPNPWPASISGNLPANTVYFGNASANNATNPDMSGTRIDNTSGVSIVVNDVSVQCTNTTFDFGGPGAGAPLAAGNTLIDGGTTLLDGSEACTPPVTVTVTLDGVAATYQDNKAGNASGSGIVGNLATNVNGTDTKESLGWTQIGVVSPSPSPVASASAATVGLPRSGGPAAPGLGDSRWLLLAAVGAVAALALVFLKERRRT